MPPSVSLLVTSRVTASPVGLPVAVVRVLQVTANAPKNTSNISLRPIQATHPQSPIAQGPAPRPSGSQLSTPSNSRSSWRAPVLLRERPGNEVRPRAEGCHPELRRAIADGRRQTSPSRIDTRPVHCSSPNPSCCSSCCRRPSACVSYTIRPSMSHLPVSATSLPGLLCISLRDIIGSSAVVPPEDSHPDSTNVQRSRSILLSFHAALLPHRPASSWRPPRRPLPPPSRLFVEPPRSRRPSIRASYPPSLA